MANIRLLLRQRDLFSHHEVLSEDAQATQATSFCESRTAAVFLGLTGISSGLAVPSIPVSNVPISSFPVPNASDTKKRAPNHRRSLHRLAKATWLLRTTLWPWELQAPCNIVTQLKSFRRLTQIQHKFHTYYLLAPEIIDEVRYALYHFRFYPCGLP
jgi:hypothetical protein